MNFDSYTDQGVEAAAELVNQLTPGFDRGRSRAVPLDAAGRGRLAAAAEASIWGVGSELSVQDVEGLFAVASRLRTVFEAAALADADLAAITVNTLLQDYHAAPQLARHDGEPWHLHFQSQEKEAGRARARGATCATALAIVIGSRGMSRMGICQASRCDRVYIDTSRNGSRHFCSSSCLSRQKVAAFRARRSPVEVAGPPQLAFPAPNPAGPAGVARSLETRGPDRGQVAARGPA
ncbi:MAG: CGNR zinc finger domain-containing protein [Candidatus Dormibacteria bacterium]